MTPDQFREDLRRSRKSLENAGGNKIIGYRCAYQWFRKKDLWALDILAEEGFLYDASYRPALLVSRKNSAQKYVNEYRTKRGKIWEFPTSTQTILNLNIPIAGGSYLRLLPHTFMYYFFNNWINKKDAPFVLYFHPWELDKDLPKITAVGRLSSIRQYRNLGKMNYILPKYFEICKFQSISEYMGIPLEVPTKDSKKENLHCIEKRNLFDFNLNKDNLSPCTLDLVPATVVIPCYNESSSLPYLAKALEELVKFGQRKYKFKFLFVNDGSTDDTAEKLQKIFGSKNDCKIFYHEMNKGVAASLITGYRKAETELVCTMDADCSYDPLDLLKMIPLIDKKVDMVTASPYHKEGFVVGVPKWRLFLSKSLSKLYHLILKNKLSTYTSCFRVFRRNSLIDLNFKYGDFRGIVEMLAVADIHGKTIIEYPTTLQCRIFGHSKMKVVKTIIGHIKLLEEIMKYRRNFHLHR